MSGQEPNPNAASVQTAASDRQTVRQQTAHRVALPVVGPHEALQTAEAGDIALIPPVYLRAWRLQAQQSPDSTAAAKHIIAERSHKLYV